jgi:large subunit ribosomal protein L32
MAVPKRRTSRSKRNKRRSHDALVVPQWVTCPSCGEPTRPHTICGHCGTYRGRKLVEIEES